MQFDVSDYVWTYIKTLGSNIFYWWNSIKKHNEIHVKTKIMKFDVSECQACWMCLTMTMSEYVSRHYVQFYFTNETVLQNTETHVKKQNYAIWCIWLCLTMSEHVSRHLIQFYSTNEIIFQNIVKFM